MSLFSLNTAKGTVMFNSAQDESARARADGWALIGLLSLFAFVVLFVFVAANMEMVVRSDLPPTASVHQGMGEPDGKPHSVQIH